MSRGRVLSKVGGLTQTIAGISTFVGVSTFASDVRIHGNITVDGTTVLSTAIANSNLANSTISFGGVSVALGAADATPAFDLSDATNYPTSSLSGTITNAQLAGSIANSKLSNSTVSFGGISLALGASDATPAFDLTDATNYPTSSLSGTITNAQLAGSIAASKLAGSIGNSLLSNSTVSYGGISLALGASDATPAFDLQDATGYPTSSLVGTITNAQLAGSIANSKLANSTMSVGGVTLTLGGTDATPAFNLTDATNYPTSSLSGTITNAQLAGSIANAKLANSTITVAAGSDSTATALGGTITFAGTNNEVDVSESSGTITVGLPNNVTIGNNLTVTGNLQVDGSTTTVNTATMTVEDKNIEIAKGAANDAAADGAGITVDSGDGDKTWNWVDSTDSWTSSEHIDLASGKGLKFNGTTVLSGTTLGSTIVSSSLTSVGTITSGVWNGTAITNANLANSTVSFGGISLALGASDATPAFDLSDATNYPTSSLSGTITNAQLAGSIANAKLANSTVSYGGVSLALGASDATPAFDLSDATNYPTSSLSGTITNAQLAGSIADSKLSTISTANKISLSALNIDGATDIGAALADADLFIVDDGGGGTNRKITASDVKTYMGAAGGAFSVSNLDIDGATDIGADIVDADEFILDDGGNGTNRRSDMSRVKKYIWSSASGDATASDSGVITLAGSIANSKLANSTVSFGGISLALGGTDATPAFDLSDATNYPTSSLSGTITNAQLAGSIANSKLANSTVSFGGISLALGGTDATPAFNLADATGLPISSGVSGLASNVATFLGTPSSSNFASVLTDETGSGSVVFSASPSFTGDITITDTAADDTAGPEFTFHRNSSSPADADYLGQIKFAGESDTSVQRNYAKITGKILDASNGSEDGAIEFAHIKGGSQTITGRFRSDSLQLLNGTGLAVNGNITTDGTIDGRDVAADGTKLDGIESGATADQTAAEIRTLVESASDSNVFTDADHSKLNAIEASATADQTGAEIKSLYEAEDDTNAFTDADHSKLDGIESNATADQTAAEIRTLVGSASDSNVFTDADHSKLDGIESGATADQTDEEIQDIVGAMLSGNTESGITVTYQDADGTIDFTVASQTDENFTTADHAKLDGIEASATADQTGAEIKSLYEGESDTNALTDALLSKLNGIESGATADQTSEEIEDIVGAMLSGNTESGITVTYQDSDGTIDFAVASQTDENFTTADHAKLDGIEAGATADQSASEILTLIKTVDGAGSGLDADSVDGIAGGSFLRSDADDAYTGALTVTGSVDIDNLSLNANTITTTAGNLTIDSAGGNTTIADNLAVSGNLTVNGTTTTVNATVVNIADKNIQVATGAADDAAADGGGITVDSGDGDKTFQFEATGDNFGSSENMNLADGKVYKIDNTSVLSATTLGSNVVSSSLTSLGTISSGVWQGTAINDTYIGTINNANKVSLTALNIDGGTDIGAALADADLLIVDDGAGGTNRKMAASRLPTYLFGKVSGDIAIASNGTATIQANSVALSTDTTGNYVAAGAVSGNGLSGSAGSEGATFTVTSNATSSNSGSTIVFRDSSGDFSAGTITASLTGNVTGNTSGSSGSCTGNAATATKLANARTIAGVSFDGSANISLNNNAITNGAGYITSSGTAAACSGNSATATLAANSTITANNSTDETVYPVFVDGATGTQGLESDTGLSYNPSSGNLTATRFVGAVTGNVTGNASGSSGSCTGNAATATKLATARTIAGVSFDGSANISLNNNAITNGAGYITATLTNEQVQDIVGAMVSGNTESGITVTYQDGDGTLDFSVASQTDNNFTNADHSKLDGIESGATADQTASEILTLIKTVDGSGSGLDADTLDGIGSGSFLRSNTADTMTATLTARAIVPQTDSTYDLGTNSVRWANVYADDVRTGDLHLSNEHRGGNDVDGTWGHYQIQEGEDDLFLFNKRSGKKYRFLLQQV